MTERFDPAKDAISQAKHKLPLTFGDEVFTDGEHIVLPTIRVEDGEDRYKVIGRVGEKLYTEIFVWRNGLPRFVSVRRSNHGEERSYRASGRSG